MGPHAAPRRSPYLHVLDHDAVGNAVGLQEDFDCLEAGEGHPEVGRVARFGGVTPKVHLVWKREESSAPSCAGVHPLSFLAPKGVL